jgi:hypothetical protein
LCGDGYGDKTEVTIVSKDFDDITEVATVG